MFTNELEFPRMYKVLVLIKRFQGSSHKVRLVFSLHVYQAFSKVVVYLRNPPSTHV